MNLFIHAGEHAHAVALRHAGAAEGYRGVEERLLRGGDVDVAALFGAVAAAHEAIALRCTQMGQQARLDMREARRLDAMLIVA